MVRRILLGVVGGVMAGVACGARPSSVASDGAAAEGIVDATIPQITTRTELTAPNSSASPLFADDYRNYNTSAQTGNGNGDLVPRAISKLSVASLVPSATAIYVETQTWFCHLATNEAGSRLVPNARCGSHIDIGYNSDDPDHVQHMIADMESRGVAGMFMDWSGKDSSHDANASYYPTATTTAHSRASDEVGTDAVYHVRAAAEASGFEFAVVEDEGITNCRNRWAGGCACWPAYGAICDETSQVISDLSYIRDHWAASPAYIRVGGKPVVMFFAPDYNACPDPAQPSCQHIDWAAVHQFVDDEAWIFENKNGYGHVFSSGGFAWPGTTSYPGSDPSFGVAGVADYDAFTATTTKQVYAGAFKGFDDAVTDGWNYGDGTHTRYIGQRCGKTWLATLAQVEHDIASHHAALQLITWDDYEEGTELETGIDTCVRSIEASVTGSRLTWAVRYGKDLTGAASGSEDTIDHFVIWSSDDGEHLIRVGSDLVRDLTGALPHSFELADPSALVFVQAVSKPFLANALSAPIRRIPTSP